MTTKHMDIGININPATPCKRFSYNETSGAGYNSLDYNLYLKLKLTQRRKRLIRSKSTPEHTWLWAKTSPRPSQNPFEPNLLKNSNFDSKNFTLFEKRDSENSAACSSLRESINYRVVLKKSRERSWDENVSLKKTLFGPLNELKSDCFDPRNDFFWPKIP